MQKSNVFNSCINWGLRCIEQKVLEKSVILKCYMNRKDRKTGQYTVPIYIDVVCPFETCDIVEDDYTQSFINVDGQFHTGEYTKKSGEKVPTISIIASKVTKRSEQQENDVFNVCKNFGLYCYGIREFSKGITLKCSMSKKDKGTGKYTEPVFIDVVCLFDRTDIPEDYYEKAFINVNGQFSAGEFTDKNNKKVASLTIFADMVRNVRYM